MAPTRGATALLSLLFVAGALAGAPADGASGGPATSVTFYFAAPDAAALQTLSEQPITDRARRLTELAALLPSATQRDAVVAELADTGYAVTGQTPWSVTATAPRSEVFSTLGQPDAGESMLPRVPAELDDLVASAFVTEGGQPLFDHTDTTTLTGSDVRNADTPAGGAPSAGGNDAGETVATLQLSNWSQSDLSRYAASQRVADPVASGQYRFERVDNGPLDSRGALEVALDQEALLSTAPSARQVAYFAPNTAAGFNDVFANLLADVTDSSRATYDPHITALSSSWGACESGFGSAADIATTQNIIASVVAAGVNVFAASGDNGIYDCGSTAGTGLDNHQEDVDFPASSPSVVAVGGTRLSAATSAPNTGANWTEKAWTCTDPVSCQSKTGTGGGGGGVSGAAFGTLAPGATSTSDFAGFARPAYQTAIDTAPYAAGSTRLVPDIAADADPQSGFVVYSSACGPRTTACTVGGTSLAAPLSAAQFANTLGDEGVSTGIGDIHPALYRAYTATRNGQPTDPATVYRDVVTGTNGDSADATRDPSVQAAGGYDTVSGLGAVLWPALTSYLPAPPPSAPGGGSGTPGGGTTSGTATGAVTNTATLRTEITGRRRHRHRIVVATWTTTATGSTVARATVTLTRGAITAYTGAAPSGTTHVRARPGRTYILTVTSVDDAGHVATSTQQVTVPRQHHHRHHRSG